MKVVIHIAAGLHVWTKSKISRNTAYLKVEKKRIQAVISKDLGIQWDYHDLLGQGGSTTMGNVARWLLFKPDNRKRIINSILNESDRKIVEKVGASLSNILRVCHQIRKFLRQSTRTFAPT